jgi:signal transduction histidine kinase
LPHADLKESSLADFLRECSEQLGHLEDVTRRPDDDGLVDQSVPTAAVSAETTKPDVSIGIRWDVPSAPLPALIDRQMLRRVLVNLVRNAGQAIRDAHAKRTGDIKGVIGHVAVTASREGDGAVIVVEDDGPGVREEMRARIFDPYFTTKDDGTGLGLAIVKKIVVEHGGSIEVKRSEALGGAKFVVHLPGTRAMALAAASRAARESQIRLENISTERHSAPP